MGMYVPGIGDAQGSEGLIVSKGRYILQLESARSSEMKDPNRAVGDGDEPIANMVTIVHRIIEAPDEALTYDRETQEAIDEEVELVGKRLEQSIYVMTDNHESYEKAGRFGSDELKDVLLAYRVPTDGDEIEWDGAIERGAQASASLAPNFEERNGNMYARNRYRGWRAIA